MLKSINQKLKLLYLIRILEQKSDEEHPLSARKLIEELEQYHISAERKSIYDDMEQLSQFGYDIVMNRSRTCGGYYLASGEFEMAELKLLVDAVQSSRFITLKKSRELISKLEKKCSIYNESQLKRQVYVNNRVKTDNENIYYNVDEIYSAIHKNRQITFQYYEWNVRKEKVSRRGGKQYQISPWSLTWNEENYYLIGFDETHDEIRHYRVDKIKNISMTVLPRMGGKQFQDFDAASYCRKTFGMYGGRDEMVTLRFPNYLAGVVIDRFGMDTAIRILPVKAEVPATESEEGYFTIRVLISVSHQFFGWLAGIGKEAVVLAPESVAKEYHQYLSDIIQKI